MFDKHKDLTAYFSAMKQKGLQDVRFDIKNPKEATKDQVCLEVSRLYKAVERGESRPLKFNDSHNHKDT